MDHLKQFMPRPVLPLSVVTNQCWHLKRYAILAKGREADRDVISAATKEALRRLPKPGSLEEGSGNHGVGFQIIHFAEVAVVSPVFYWQWGSVLAQTAQMRAQWDDPLTFEDGAQDVVGCIWEMNIMLHETKVWQKTMLGPAGGSQETLKAYLEQLPKTS